MEDFYDVDYDDDFDDRWARYPSIEEKKYFDGVKLYLCAAMDRAEDGGKKWRREITPILEDLGFQVLDPSKNGMESTDERSLRKQNKILGHYDEFAHTMKFIVGTDLKMVDESEILIVNLEMNDRPFGTIHEMVRAIDSGKFVAVFCSGGKVDVPDWVFGIIPHQWIFESKEELINWLSEFSRNNKDLG